MRLENEIVELESKRAEIDALLTQQNWSNNPETVALIRKRKEIEELLAAKEQEWEKIL